MGMFALLMLLNIVHFGTHRNRRTGARFVYITTLTGTRKSALIGFGVASVAGFLFSLLPSSSNWLILLPAFVHCYYILIVSIFCRARELDE